MSWLQVRQLADSPVQVQHVSQGRAILHNLVRQKVNTSAREQSCIMGPANGRASFVLRLACFCFAYLQ